MQDRQLLYIIGYPGAGKSTLLRAALEGIPARPAAISIPQTIPHRIPAEHRSPTKVAIPFLKYPGGIQIGGARAAFPGTDALAMNVQPAVLQFLSESSYKFVVAEGDRLGNDKFFNALTEAGWQLTVCWLNLSEELAAARRRERGSNQNEIWLKGRISKVNRLGEKWASINYSLNAGLPVSMLAEQLKEHPVIKGLRG